MKHKVKVTVLDKKLYPELQQQYCADPNSGVCACYNVGDEFMFYRDDERDDYWHMGAGTLIKSGQPDEGMQVSGTAEIVEPWSEEYLALLAYKKIPAESLKKMPVEMHLIRIRPKAIDFLNSSFKEQGADSRQHLEMD